MQKSVWGGYHHGSPRVKQIPHFLFCPMQLAKFRRFIAWQWCPSDCFLSTIGYQKPVSLTILIASKQNINLHQLGLSAEDFKGSDKNCFSSSSFFLVFLLHSSFTSFFFDCSNLIKISLLEKVKILANSLVHNLSRSRASYRLVKRFDVLVYFVTLTWK